MRKRGDTIEAGDVLVIGRQSHQVSEVEPYTHPTLGETAGIARCSDGFAITLERTVWLEVAS